MRFTNLDDIVKRMEEPVCPFCGDTGWVTEPSFDPDSHQEMQGTDARKCICQIDK